MLSGVALSYPPSLQDKDFLAAGGTDCVASCPVFRVRLAEIGDVPENVIVRSWVPQADLLRLVDVIVHHGGSGTTLGALTVGAPQLILPQGAD